MHTRVCKHACPARTFASVLVDAYMCDRVYLCMCECRFVWPEISEPVTRQVRNLQPPKHRLLVDKHRNRFVDNHYCGLPPMMRQLQASPRPAYVQLQMLPKEASHFPLISARMPWQARAGSQSVTACRMARAAQPLSLRAAWLVQWGALAWRGMSGAG